MNKNYSNVGKIIWRALKYKEIKAKEVGNVITGNREVRLVSWATHRFSFRIVFLFAVLSNEHFQI